MLRSGKVKPISRDSGTHGQFGSTIVQFAA
jgi:hypothetical protein